MAALDYKLEFVKNDKAASDDSVYVHLRVDVPTYLTETGKEEYKLLEEADQHEFLSSLLAVPGVVEISTTAYRIWLMKSPVFSWGEVLEEIMEFLRVHFNKDELNQLPGSGNLDGSGTRLESLLDRRDNKIVKPDN